MRLSESHCRTTIQQLHNWSRTCDVVCAELQIYKQIIRVCVCVVCVVCVWCVCACVCGVYVIVCGVCVCLCVRCVCVWGVCVSV
jgi:hypothetical protein